LKNKSYIRYIKQLQTQKHKTMEKQMTRKEAATIMKKYEVNGMIGEHFKSKPKPKQEYFEAKQRWNEIVKEQK
jgi:hypothetical protein